MPKMVRALKWPASAGMPVSISTMGNDPPPCPALVPVPETMKSPFEPIVQLVMSTEKCCAPPPGPPCRWPQPVSSASPRPPLSNSTQPQKPPRLVAPQTEGLSQLNDRPTCHNAVLP